MNERFWQRWRELFGESDHAAALHVETATIRKAAEGSIHPGLARTLDELAGDPTHALRLGRFLEGPRRDQDLLVHIKDLLTHLLVLGASGTGKSYFILLLALELLRRKTVRSLVVLDMKGELAELMTELALPGLVASLPAQGAKALLDRIVVINPFDRRYVPPLNVLVPDPDLPIAIQARDVAECFETATESDVTARMETLHDWNLRLVIETNRRVTQGKGSFLTVRRALQEPTVLEGLVRLCQDREIIQYFLTRYSSEPKASKLALLARLDRFLALPMTQLSLGASVCLDFDALLKDRITIVSLGNAPAGLQSVAKFFAMVVLTRFVRAIFRLPSRSQGFHSVLIADEWQVALNGALAAEFESILTLARSRGVHLWLANQQLSQLEKYGAALRSILLGQTDIQMVFRLAGEDARLFKNLFPVTGAMRRHAVGGGTGSPFLTAHEEVEARMAAANKLPKREGYWADRPKAWGAVPFRTATLALPSPSSIPAVVLRQTKYGTITFSVADLERMRDEEDARLDGLAAGSVPRAAPGGTPMSPRPPSTPTRAPLVSPASPSRPGKRLPKRLPRIR